MPFARATRPALTLQVVQVMCSSGAVFRGDLEHHERVSLTFSKFLAAVLNDGSAEVSHLCHTQLEAPNLTRQT